MSQPHCVPELMTDCYAAADAGGTLLFVNAAAQRWLDPEATGQPLTMTCSAIRLIVGRRG